MLWSNSNINENFPDVVTPLLYSIAREGYYHYFRNLAVAFGLSKARTKAMESAFSTSSVCIMGRLYYNLTSIHDILREAPFGETLARFFNQFVGAEQVAANLGRNTVHDGSSGLKLQESPFRRPARYVSFERRIVEFERRADAFAAATEPENLSDRPILRLRDDMRSFMDIRCHGWTNASLADTAAMVCYGSLRLILHRAYPAREESVTAQQSVEGTFHGHQRSARCPALGNLPEDTGVTRASPNTCLTANSSDIPETLTRHSDWRWLSQDIHEYLHQWGYRFSGELMLTVPSFQEEFRSSVRHAEDLF